MKKEEKIKMFLDGIDNLIEQGKYKRAEKFLRKYIDDNDRDCYPAINKLGRVLIRIGNSEEAIKLLEPLLYINGIYRWRAIYTLAHAYANVGNYKRSIELIDIYCNNPYNYRKECSQELKELKKHINF